MEDDPPIPLDNIQAPPFFLLDAGDATEAEAQDAADVDVEVEEAAPTTTLNPIGLHIWKNLAD